MMQHLLSIPLDFLAFVYGTITLLIAGSFEFARARRVANLPWGWLVLSASLHAFANWTFCVKFNVAFWPPVQFLSMATMLGSMLALIEFSRRVWPGLGQKRLSLLVHPGAVALLFSGKLIAPEAATLTVRLTSLACGLFVALALKRHAEENAHENRNLPILGWSFLGYFCTQILSTLTHARPFVLVGEQESLRHFASLSVHILTSIPILVMAQRLAHAGVERVLPGRRVQFKNVVFTLGIALLVPAFAASLAHVWTSREMEKSEETARTYMIAYREGLAGVAQRANDIAQVGSASARLQAGLTETSEGLAGARAALVEFCKPLAPSTCTLMDKTGRVLASSAPQVEQEKERLDFSHREYFQEALATGFGASYHVGTINREPGYFAAHALVHPNGPSGIFVVNMPLTQGRFYAATPLRIFLVNDEEQVFAAGTSEEVGRPLFLGRGSAIPPVFATNPNANGIFFAENKIFEAHTQRVGTPGMKLVLAMEWEAGNARAIAYGISILLCTGILIGLVHQAKLRGTALALRQTKEAEARLLRIIENAPDLIGIAAPTGEILYHNPASLKTFGRGEPGASIARLHPPEAFETLRDVAIPKAIEAGFWMGETCIRNETGETIPVSQLIIAHRNGAGEVECLSTIIRDISESKRMERERERMQAQLFHAGKLASIGTLAAGIAHEINNPLAIILGYIRVLETLLPRSADFRQQREILSKQEKAVHRISHIVSGLKSFARIDTEDEGMVDLHSSIRETLEMVASLLEQERVQIELNLEAFPSTVKGNNGKIQQVLINLLTNARDAMEDRPEKHIWIHTWNLENEVVVEITDTGHGMDRSVVERIFDPFFTTKEPGRGTGLGLSISHSIVSAMQGSIAVDSHPGRGTTFSIRLPGAS